VESGLIVLFVLALRSFTLLYCYTESSAFEYVYLHRSRWPESLNCERFPLRGENVCIDRPQDRSQVTVTPASGSATGEVTCDGVVD